MSKYDSLQRIYVACLASYNNGVLHGVWIDCEGKDADDIQDEVNAMLRASRFPNVEVDCPTCCDMDPQDTDRDCATCKGRGKVPSAEEWAIHDHEGFGRLLGEYSSFETVVKHARMLAEHGEAWGAYVEHVGEDYATEESFQDAYQGTYDSAEDWSEQFLEETDGLESIPENLRYYFDYEKYARDADLGGDITVAKLSSGRVVVFWNR